MEFCIGGSLKYQSRQIFFATASVYSIILVMLEWLGFSRYKSMYSDSRASEVVISVNDIDYPV